MLVVSVGNEPVSTVGFSADGWFVYAATKSNRLVKVSADGAATDALPSGVALTDLRGFVIDPRGESLFAITASVIVPVSTGLPDPSFHVIAPSNANGLTCAAVVGFKLLAIGSGFGIDRPVAGYFRLLTLPAGKERGPAVTEKGGVLTISNHESSNTVAWATGTREIVVWDLGKPDRVRMSFQHPAAAIAFTADGTMIAAAMQWNVALWDWKKKQERAVCKGHKGRVTAVTCLPDGSILTASWDGTVKVWDMSGKELRSLDFQQGRLTGLAVAPDGSRAVVGTDRGTIVIWDLV